GAAQAPANSATRIVPRTFLALLDQSERDALDRLGVVQSFPRGSLLMFEREPGERVMILLAGRVKVSHVGRDGHELILSIRDPGDVIGDATFVDRHPRVASVTAIDPVRALVTSSRMFCAYLEHNPRVAVVLLEVITRRLRESTVILEQFAELDTIGRLAARIVELSVRYGTSSDCGATVTVMLPLTREELAAWTGASRAGVAHALQTLRGLGWIQTERRRLLVRDLQALRERAA
ncbi:MAG TPA: Crp/Fnr family transcriptional regulator, partial [Solirubrobacteraceae bacterium]|nr:Crp/Fnr family transcriptional regulator [Solirubrobacteraceae bacterium]